MRQARFQHLGPWKCLSIRQGQKFKLVKFFTKSGCCHLSGSDTRFRFLYFLPPCLPLKLLPPLPQLHRRPIL